MRKMALALLGAALVVVPSSANAQEKIDGQYIVVLKDNASGERAKEKARTRGGRIQRESFGRVLNGFTAKLDSQALAAVEQDPTVDFVEQDQVSVWTRRRPTRPGAWIASTSATGRSARPTATTRPARA